MGSIVLQNNGNKKFKIIDGQQRIATISILVLAGLKILQQMIDNNNEAEQNKERKEILMNTFLGSKDAISLNYSTKLTLNENNNAHYQTYLLNFHKPPVKINDSNKLMSKAFDYFLNKLGEQSFSKSGKDLSGFIEKTIGDKLLFIQISVEDELSAYTVFETLNARGLDLTSTDLLKNYLFSLVRSDTDMSNLKNLWKNIVEIVGIKRLPQFLRYYLNSKQSLIREERLFKEIKNKITHQDLVFPLLTDLVQYADVFAAIDEKESELWSQRPDVRKLIDEISLFRSVQHKSLLMAAYFYLDPEEFVKVLRIVRAVIFRYITISALNPNILEESYNKVAVKISKKEISKASEIFLQLGTIYLTDEDFKNNFSTKTFNTKNTKDKKLVRYILASIEKQKYNAPVNIMDVDATIEHILPEKPTEEWLNDFDANSLDNIVYRLGNLSLLEEKLNKEASDKNFIHKKSVYLKSEYKITSKIDKYETWDFDAIKRRQHRLAEIAVSVWKADY